MTSNRVRDILTGDKNQPAANDQPAPVTQGAEDQRLQPGQTDAQTPPARRAPRGRMPLFRH